MWDCAWCSLPSDSTGVELLPGREQPPVHTEVPAQPWAQKRRTDTGKHRSAVPHHCFPPQNESWTEVKCCHSTNRVTEGKKDAVMCPRLPRLTEVLPGVQDTILPTTGHGLSIRVGCLKAGAVPCSASLVPSTAGTITARWRTALFTAALLTISHWKKICTKNTALRNSEKGEDVLPC